MKIGEVAKETGLSISNIRFYEKKGLLKPERDVESKYREYSEEDVEQLKKIIVLRRMDIPIETIYILFKNNISLTEVLKRQGEELQTKIEAFNGAMGLCKVMQEKRDTMDFDPNYYLQYVEEKEKSGQHFAAIAEAVEDISDYTEGVFYAARLWSIRMNMGKYGWIAKLCYVGYWIALAGTIVVGAITGELTFIMILILLILLIPMIIKMIQHRKERGVK